MFAYIYRGKNCCCSENIADGEIFPTFLFSKAALSSAEISEDVLLPSYEKDSFHCLTCTIINSKFLSFWWYGGKTIAATHIMENFVVPLLVVHGMCLPNDLKIVHSRRFNFQ